MVIELNLCPFARAVFEADKIRYIVTDAGDEATLITELAGELKTLAASPVSSIETTLLIHPRALTDYLDYNDFLDAGDRTIGSLGLHGIIQIAGFHPDYQFAGSDT